MESENIDEQIQADLEKEETPEVEVVEQSEEKTFDNFDDFINDVYENTPETSIKIEYGEDIHEFE